MIFDYDNKTIQIKIVYYGPAMSGKTTSIKYLFSCFGKENTIESIDSSVGRTLFFDFGVLQFKGLEWTLKILLYSATGQDFYASTRPATLNGVDGIIFVLDSQLTYLEHNLRSWNELKTLFANEFYDIPVVIALNKYDLEGVDKLSGEDFISKIESEKFKYLSLNNTVATKGIGIVDSFKHVMGFIFPQLQISIELSN